MVNFIILELRGKSLLALLVHVAASVGTKSIPEATKNPLPPAAAVALSESLGFAMTKLLVVPLEIDVI